LRLNDAIIWPGLRVTVDMDFLVEIDSWLI